MVKLCICIFVYNLYVHMFCTYHSQVWECICVYRKTYFVLHIPFFMFLPVKMLLVGGWFLICGLWGILFVSEFLPFYKGHSMSNYRRKFTTHSPNNNKFSFPIKVFKFAICFLYNSHLIAFPFCIIGVK